MPDHIAESLPLVITGADGRIGRLLQAAWVEEPPDAVAPIWCARAWGHWQDLLAGPLDPCPTGAVILHLAADLSATPDALVRSAAMARAVAVAARQGRARHILFASSAAVYAPSDRDLTETSACIPTTPYGQAKILAEQACRADAGDVPVTSLRIGNVLGASALIGATCEVGRIELDPVLGRSGGPVRSWIAPGELARVLSHLARLAGAPGCLPPVLNLASPGAWSMADLLDAADFSWRYGPYRTRVLPRLSLDCTRLAGLCPQLAITTPTEMIADWRATMSRGVSA